MSALAAEVRTAPVAEHPILFSGSMVRAILAGTKTQTRRLLRVPSSVTNPRRCNVVVADGVAIGCEGEHPRAQGCEADFTVKCPYGKPGDRLWVRERLRETACTWHYEADDTTVRLPADHPDVLAMVAWAHHKENSGCPSIHMPRWASRITLEVTGVRVEPLQKISEEDAQAEGVEKGPSHRVYPSARAAIVSTYRAGFETAWKKINGARDGADWARNPWVWVVTFRRLP